MALTSLIRQVEVLDTSVTTGAGLTGKVHSDFTASYCIDGGTLVSLTTETITTLGTYQAPTSSAHIRIKELNSADPTKGMYEVHFHNGQLSSGTRLWLYMSVAGGKPQRLEVDLQDVKSVNLVQILGTTLTETAGYLAAGFKKFFNVATPTSTMNQITLVDTTTTNTDMRGTDSAATAASLATAQADLDILTGADGAIVATGGITAASIATDAIDADAIAADAVTEIQSGLATASALSTVSGYIDTEVQAIYDRIGAPAGLSVSADIAAIKAETASIQTDTNDLKSQIGTAGAGLTGIPKTGYKLASDGLDVIDATIPSAVATTFPGMIKQLWSRFFYKSTLSSTELITYASDGTTVVTTQTVSDTGTLQTQGKAS